MTVSEFKAWLEGLETALGGNPPSAEQWAAIKAKISKVSDAPKVAYRDVMPSRTWLGGQMADGAVERR
jgi:hypothetical protein